MAGELLSSLGLTAAHPAPHQTIDLSELGEPDLVAQMELSRLPRHIAVIMDGNGRWARRRRLPRIAGHRAGASAVHEIVETGSRLHLKALTLFAFSTENWKRPQTEISTLMSLLREYLRKELAEIHRNNIRLQILGRYEQLPVEVRGDLDDAMRITGGNTGMVLNVALNYSARSEMVDTIQSIIARVQRGELRTEDVTERTVSENLSTGGLPDPDLLIRTSGEMRVSNFLLWQIAYAEIYVTETCWPDFTRRHLLEAIIDFQKRERRYGGLGEHGA
ncbi:MAG: isoprenyl transferase [Acidobacteria bacterium]|nr:isoprenyl transferase [Acidobacteriota bacterium]